jgi:hypothetical protein
MGSSAIDTPNTLPPQEKVDPNYINEAGDVITEYMNVITGSGQAIDISNFVLSTTLYEDMFSNTLSGHVTLLDSADLFNIVPFEGLEYIAFSFRTPSFTETISKMFKIVGAKDRVMSSSDREQMYTLHFVSMEAVMDNIIKISQKFSGTTDVVVSKIWKNNLTWPRFGFNTDPTPVIVADNNTHASSVSFVASSWSPFRAINWVCNRSFKTAGDAPTFVFFESNKAFYFRNIEEIINTQSSNNKIFTQYGFFPGAAALPASSINPNVMYTKPDLPKQYNLARNMKSFNVFDILRGQDAGFYAAKLLIHDINLMTYQEFFFDYYAPYAKEVTPNKNNEAFPQGIFRNAETAKTVRTRNYKLFNDYADPLYQKWMLQRNSLMYELSNVKVEIEVPGRTDIEVGKVVEFLYPKATNKLPGSSTESNMDPLITAQYLITAIRHEFSLNKHTQYIEMVRFI